MISWRNIGTSLVVGLALLAFGSSGCGRSGLEGRAADHAAPLLGVDEDELRVTQRSDLSTDRHAVLRVSVPDGGRELTVVLARHGGLVLDASMPDAFARLAQAEDLDARFELLGGTRVAGWFGALGGNGVCGEPFAIELRGVSVVALDGGARQLSYQFAEDGKLKTCRFELGADGHVRGVEARTMPVAGR